MIDDKAVSVTEQGTPDGFVPAKGWVRQVFQGGRTRLIVTAPAHEMAALHRALVASLAGPFRVRYHQRIDRRSPVPGAPERDFVALQVDAARVLSALERCPALVYGDARHELWVLDRHGAQVVLDGDGIMYVYPDDPSARDVLAASGCPEDPALQTLLDRDYVMHRFLAVADAEEDALIAWLGLTLLG